MIDGFPGGDGGSTEPAAGQVPVTAIIAARNEPPTSLPVSTAYAGPPRSLLSRTDRQMKPRDSLFRRCNWLHTPFTTIGAQRNFAIERAADSGSWL